MYSGGTSRVFHLIPGHYRIFQTIELENGSPVLLEDGCFLLLEAD